MSVWVVVVVVVAAAAVVVVVVVVVVVALPLVLIFGKALQGKLKYLSLGLYRTFSGAIWGFDRTIWG